MTENDWKKGLCGCFSNRGNCLATLFCWPCIYGKLANLSGWGHGVRWAIIMLVWYGGFYVSAIMLKRTFRHARCLRIEIATNSGYNVLPSELAWHENSCGDVTPSNVPVRNPGDRGFNINYVPMMNESVRLYNSTFIMVLINAGLNLLAILASVLLLSCLRRKVRSHRNFNGNRCGDFALSCCCGACVLCQMANEYEDEDIKPWNPFHYPKTAETRVEVI